MTKLLVAGCSFSDYTKISKVYGEFLSEAMGISEYIHEARGCGSNHRIWREIVNHVLSKNITSEDFVIVQYTQVLRLEYWTPHRKEIIPITNDRNISDPYKDDGTILRFKIDSHTWQDHRDEINFFKIHEKFINYDFEYEKFIVHHNMFQTFMAYNGFKKLFFLKGGTYGPPYDLISEYKNNYIDGSKLLENHLDGDEHHLNQIGHEKTAEFILKFFKDNNIL